ncbi:MAG: hypothetical protein V4662_17845 [Verrucomicrobiota bacterium]
MSLNPLQEVLTWRFTGLPDEASTVLIQTSLHVVDAAFIEGGEWMWASGGIVEEEVVYWSPMPEGIMTRSRMQAEAKLTA